MNRSVRFATRAISFASAALVAATMLASNAVAQAGVPIQVPVGEFQEKDLSALNFVDTYVSCFPGEYDNSYSSEKQMKSMRQVGPYVDNSYIPAFSFDYFHELESSFFALVLRRSDGLISYPNAATDSVFIVEQVNNDSTCNSIGGGNWVTSYPFPGNALTDKTLETKYVLDLSTVSQRNPGERVRFVIRTFHMNGTNPVPIGFYSQENASRKPKLYVYPKRWLKFPISPTLFPDGAYTKSKVTSVVDHELWQPYQKTGTIVSFTGQGFIETSDYPRSIPAACYPIEAGQVWNPILKSIYKGTGSSSSANTWDNCSKGAALNYDGHPGTDYSAPAGTEVLAGGAGVVVKVPGTGARCIVMPGISEGCAAWGAVGIDHGNGYITQYLHLSQIDVAAGQEVQAGQVIGLSGSKAPKGKKVSPHLHFEVLKVMQRFGKVNDYMASSYGYIDPYGFNPTEKYSQDPLYMTSGELSSICLWQVGCPANYK